MIGFLDNLLDFLFPTACVICDADGPDLCANCIIDFRDHKPQNYDWTVSLWDYHDPQVEKLLRSIKNHPNTRVAKILADTMIGKLQLAVSRNPHFAQTHNAIVIPIPIGRARFRERGYNQSLLLTRPLAKILHREIRDDILIKSKQTKKQGTTKSKAERLANVVGSFAVPASAARCARGRDIILIDDITTTGATLFEARKSLLAAGARRVVAVTIAN